MSSKAVALNLLPLRGYSTAAEAAHHFNETSMRNAHELLIVALAHLDLLFPVRVFPNHQRPYSFLHQQVNDMAACRVHVVVNSSATLGGHAFHASGEAWILKDAL